MTTTIQPHPSPLPRHPRWEAIKRSFTQSNYITDFWNWLMTLMSKAAELVLFGSVLYSGYQLLPHITHAPAQVDAVVFVIQQAALDIGGMGLLKLAKRAGLPKDSFPMRVGVILVVLMILNVVLASLKQTIPLIPPGVFIGIETSLLIARAIMAVLFGYAIHALREEYGESTITVKEASELRADIEVLASKLAQVHVQVQQGLQTVQTHLHMQWQGEIAHLQDTMQVQTQALQASIQVQVQRAIAPLQEALQTTHHMQSTMQEQLQCLETALYTNRPAHPQGERHAEKPPRLRMVRASTIAVQPGEPRWNARAFVFACLQVDPTLHIAAIKQRASESNQTLSDSSICRYRQQFFASNPAAMKAANQ